MTTAVFIFANGCPACIRFKLLSYDKIVESYKRQGISIVEYTAPDLRGLKNMNVPELAKTITFFPSLYLTDVSYLNSDLATSLENSEVMCGTFTGEYMIPSSTQEYDFMSPVDYNRFYDVYRSLHGINEVMGLTARRMFRK